ncbi:MAG: hypothetical protein ACI38Q_05045 [Candidatus Bruticola sp.]
MAKKNKFGFIAFTAAASLGLALTAAGCGTHNGSSEAASLGGNNSVIFRYYLTPAQRAFVLNDITKVRYSFLDGQGSVLKTTQAYDLKHTSQLTERNISVPNVPSVAYKVAAAYYDDFGSIVAVGVNNIEWDYDLVQAEVETPQISKFVYSDTGLQASSYVLKPDKITVLSLPVTTTDGSDRVVNLIAFADVTGLEGYTDVLEPIEDSQTYKGVSFTGEHKGVVPAGTVKAVVPIADGNISATLDRPIYVTSQTIASIKLEPTAIDDTAITVRNADTDTPYSKILTFDPALKNADLGQKVAVFHPYHEPVTETEAVAIGTQYFTVTGVYSDTANRGPVPEDVDVTDLSTFTIEQESEMASITKNRVDVYKQVLEPLGVNSVLVKASFSDQGQLDEPLTAQHRLDVYYGEGNVGLTHASDYEDGIILETLSADDIPEKDGLPLDMVGTIVYVPGDIDTELMSTSCFVLPESIVSEYPELETYCAYEVGKLNINNVAGNQYRLSKNTETYGEITKDHVIRLVNQADYTKLALPTFYPLPVTAPTE